MWNRCNKNLINVNLLNGCHNQKTKICYRKRLPNNEIKELFPITVQNLVAVAHGINPLDSLGLLCTLCYPFLSLSIYTLIFFQYFIVYLETMHFHYNTIGLYVFVLNSTRIPAPGVMQFTILIEPSLVIISIFVWFMLRGREEES